MQSIYSGLGSIHRVKEFLKNVNSKKILLVTGRKSYSSSGAKEFFDKCLDGLNVTHFYDFEINPKLEDAKKGAILAKDNNVEVIISIGGGSVLDISKLIKAFINDPTKAEDYAKGNKKIIDSKIPIIAIPTTAGSGSESTHFAVVYINGTKFSVASECLLPEFVVLDGELITSASKYQKANNILDAVAQSIESSWSISSTKESSVISFRALEISFNNYKDFYSNNDKESAQMMLKASNLAGQAINITKTTAPHAWSYAISMHLDLPHGHAIWATLPKVFRLHCENKIRKNTNTLNQDKLNNTMRDIKEVLGIKDNNEINSFFKKFLLSLDIKASLKDDLKVSYGERKELSKKVNQQRMSNNPIKFTQNDINYIFQLENFD